MASATLQPSNQFTKEAETLAELKNFYLHILGAPDDYGLRVYRDSNAIPSAGLSDEAGTDVRVNPLPQLIDKDIEFQRENFYNLKLAYLEQETKEKFVRAVVSDPPLVIEASDIGRIEAENNAKKEGLKRQKQECKDMQRELEELSRQVCVDYGEVVGAKREAALRMMAEMEVMREEIGELEAKHAQLRFPEDEADASSGAAKDPELMLPLESIKELIGEYNEGVKTAGLGPLAAELEQKADELAASKRAIEDLSDAHKRVQKSAQETVKMREQGLKRGLEEKEATAKWYRNMLVIFSKATGVSDLQISKPAGQDESQAGETVFSFKLLQATFEMVVNDSGRLVRAAVQDPLERVTDEKLEEILEGTLASYRTDPSMFLCQICFLLGNLSA